MPRPNYNVHPFYNNRTIHCYKYVGGSDEPRSPPAVDEDQTSLTALTVAQMHDTYRSLPPLEMTHDDLQSESGDVAWPEFLELFQTISDDADAMQDDLLPALERRAMLMEPSPDKDALLSMIASYNAKVNDFFEVLNDIDADIEMLKDMIAFKIVEVGQVEACIAAEPPSDSEGSANQGNWEAYIDLVYKLRTKSLTSDQQTRLIVETRKTHGDLTPIGLVGLLEVHHRSFLKWEANIDAWNSVLEETQNYAERDALYNKACRDENFLGTKEQYENRLRTRDSGILRQMGELRRGSIHLESQIIHLLSKLAALDAASPEYAVTQDYLAEIRAKIDENTSTYGTLHSSLSPVSLLDHLQFDDSRLLHDITSDFKAKIRKNDEPMFERPVKKRQHTAETATHATQVPQKRIALAVTQVAPTTVVAPSKIKEDKQRCECWKVKTKVECQNKPGCKWRMGIGCCKAPN